MNKDGFEKFDEGIKQNFILDITTSKPLEYFH